MRRAILLSAAVLVVPAVALRAQHDHPDAGAGDSAGPPPLYQNLGTLHRAIRTTSPLAQKYFDQGLRLTYAFNHAEAIRAFQYATQLDSTCAMCWWGIANALGPNINDGMHPDAVRPAYGATQRAVALAKSSSTADRALIEAAAVRYTDDSTANRAPLDSAYAAKLRVATRRFPNDPDIGTLFAESMLDLRPWNQWKKDGTPQPGTLEAVAALERVITKYPNHAGACHFYIHTVEGSHTPERALPCANRLPALMPGAGHLVHMPAHIALRVGNYTAAIAHNQHAVHADEVYLDGPHTESIYGVAYTSHNWHFLSVAASLAGQSALAVDAAEHTRKLIPLEIARELPLVEYWIAVPYFALVRFSKWDELLAEPAPEAGLRYTNGMWRYGRGMALANKGDLDAAQVESDSLSAILQATAPDALAGIQSAATLLGIADETLKGTLAARRGDDAGAVSHLEQAVALDDQLLYDEPPPEYIPPRQLLGTELLRQHRPKEAAAVFRADLKDHRENGWSLRGLTLALEAMNQKQEAKLVDARWKKAWKEADVMVQ